MSLNLSSVGLYVLLTHPATFAAGVEMLVKALGVPRWSGQLVLWLMIRMVVLWLVSVVLLPISCPPSSIETSVTGDRQEVLRQGGERVFAFRRSDCKERGGNHDANGATVASVPAHCMASEVSVARPGLPPLSGLIRSCRCVIPSAVTAQSSRSNVVPGGLKVYS